MMKRLPVLLLLCMIHTRSISCNAGEVLHQHSKDDLTMLKSLEKAHPMWLRERCGESFYADPDTRQPKYNLHEEQDDLTVTKVQIDVDHELRHGHGAINNTGFRVTFSDHQECFFAQDVMEREWNNEARAILQAKEWGLPDTFIWNKSLVAPPSFHHDSIITESDETKKFLSTLISIGIALVTDVPRVEGECARFGQRFSSLRETEWGTNFNVRSKPDTASSSVRKDLAYTANSIGMHVDSPYRIDTPPSFQLLHAIDHCQGPDCFVHNRFVDGFAVANAICKSDRSAFDSLTKVVLRWENNGGDDSSVLFRYAPMIELEVTSSNSEDDNVCPNVKSINFSAKSGGYAPNLPLHELELFYRAKRLFSAMLHDDDTYTIAMQLFPGALVFFDNRRVLHSRSQIAPTDGERWLQGCYLNRDGIYFLYERMRRKWARLTETPFRSLKEAEKKDFDRMGIEYDRQVGQKTVTNLIGMLDQQKSTDAYLGAPVHLYEHNIQTATRALRAGEEDETIVVSLFHDIFETLAVKNHGELIAAMLAPWVSPKSQWLLAHHEIFQGYYYFDHYGGDKDKREMFLNHTYYAWTVEWCERYDQESFDPDYPSLPLANFLPIVERVLSKPQYWWNPSHPKAGAVSASQSSLEAVASTSDADVTTF